MIPVISVNCENCGRETESLDKRNHCPECAHVYIQSCIEGARGALEVLEGAIAATLNGLASPEDVLKSTCDVISRMETTPMEPLAAMLEESRGLNRSRGLLP